MRKDLVNRVNCIMPCKQLNTTNAMKLPAGKKIIDTHTYECRALLQAAKSNKSIF